MEVADYPLDYEDDARSVHTLLRVIDPSDNTNTAEGLFDNLTTPFKMIQFFGWRIRQEFLGFAKSPTAEQLTPDDATETQALAAQALGAWRAHVSGPGDDALVIEVWGNPAHLTA